VGSLASCREFGEGQGLTLIGIREVGWRKVVGREASSVFSCMLRQVLALAAGCHVLTRTASAQASNKFALEYEAPAKCPSGATVVSAVVGRVDQLEEAADAPASRRYRIVLQQSGSSYLGRIEQAGVTVREVSGADCARVADALSLVLALALRSSGSQATESEGDEVAEAGALTRASSEARVEPKTPAARTSTSQEQAVRSQDAGLQKRPLAWAVGVGAASCWGCAPDLLVGPTVTLERSHDAGWLFVGASGEWAYGVGRQRDWLWSLAPELGVRTSWGSIDLSAAASVPCGELRLKGAGAASTWVAPELRASMRVRSRSSWWAGFGASAGLPLYHRQISTGERAGFETGHLVIGLDVSFGFGKVTEAGITNAARGHSRL
jgi:hypothetical protein